MPPEVAGIGVLGTGAQDRNLVIRPGHLGGREFAKLCWSLVRGEFCNFAN